MKVEYPMYGLSYTSQDALPASCTSKPQVACTSTPKPSLNEGYSNQEIYEGIVKIKNHIKTFFGMQENEVRPLDYVI